MRASLWAITATVAIALVSGAAGFAGTTTLTESGSTLLQPLMDRWTQAYEASHPSVSITTSGTGSGAGIVEAAAGRASMGASDAYLSDQAMRATPMVHVPVVLGAQQINYNIPELRGEHLKLDAPVLAGIYSGTIAMWDDTRIKALNGALASRLPHQPIVPIQRSDSSGDTFLFTQYLSAGDAQWKKTVGFGTRVAWPNVARASMAKGNAEVVNLCASVPYSIAYIGISYFDRATGAGLDYAALRGGSGDFVLPTPESMRAAIDAAGRHVPADARLSMIAVDAPNAYPIVNVEYLVIRAHQPDAATAAALKAFLGWVISPDGGQEAQLLSGLHLLPLTATFERVAQRQIAEIH